MNKSNYLNILLMVMCNVCFVSIGMSVCLKDNLAISENFCTEKTVSEVTSIDALSYIPIEEGLLKVGGGVCMSMGKQQLSTQELFYNDEKQSVKIATPLTYSDGKQIIKSESAFFDLKNETATIKNAQYKLNEANGNGNGKADELKTKKNITNLFGLTYSTCPINDQQWYIKAESAELDQENQVGIFRKMTLKFKGVPILYLPYAKIPLSDKRETGFLIPEIGHSTTNGFDIALPYYINIAENMDATLTPRYFSRRGTMLGVEYRYLGDDYKGEIFSDYLPSDKITKTNRRFLDFRHRHSFGSNWLLSSHISNVSDSDYFEDFGNNINVTSQSYLYSYVNINGFGDNWLFKGQLNDYQIISDNITLNSQPYQALPKLEFSWYNNDYTSSLNYGIDSEWSNFYRENSITSSRLDAMPYVEKSFQNTYSRFTPRLAYRYTSWNYADTQFSTIQDLQESRTLPIVSLDYTLNFEKQFSDGSFSSLEPRFYYLNAPFKNQQNIPLFDTHELTFGSGLLYQPNAFSGADRQSDANQISFGITQRHFNELGTEKWNVTFGQIVYFDDRQVQLDSSTETRPTSPIISEFNYFYRNWKATMSLHWDTEVDKSERALLKFQYKGKNNSLFNFAYRFRRGKIEQLDSSVVLPIGANNRFVARWNYSLDEHKTIEAIAGFEHKNCCWASRLVARRYVINDDGDTNNGIFFELQLNGLGAIGRNPRRFLQQSILGYSEEF